MEWNTSTACYELIYYITSGSIAPTFLCGIALKLRRLNIT